MNTKELFKAKAAYAFFAGGFAIFTIVLLLAVNMVTNNDPEPAPNSPGTNSSSPNVDPVTGEPIEGEGPEGTEGEDPENDPEEASAEAEALQQDREDVLIGEFGADPERVPESIKVGDRFPIYTNQGEYTCSFTDMTPQCSNTEGDYVRDDSVPLIYGAAGQGNIEDFPEDEDQR